MRQPSLLVSRRGRWGQGEKGGVEREEVEKALSQLAFDH